MATFGWCNDGKHDECIRTYRPYYIEVIKGKSKVVYRDEERVCQCPKRGCPCYVKAADRTKTRTRRKK